VQAQWFYIPWLIMGKWTNIVPKMWKAIRGTGQHILALSINLTLCKRTIFTKTTRATPGKSNNELTHKKLGPFGSSIEKKCHYASLGCGWHKIKWWSAITRKQQHSLTQSITPIWKAITQTTAFTDTFNYTHMEEEDIPAD
jgi:hypothetical protein